VAGKPDQFCIMLEGTGGGSVVSVSEFPVAWKVTVVEDVKYKGFEYVRYDLVSRHTALGR
jgi:hypothetical protein